MSRCLELPAAGSQRKRSPCRPAAILLRQTLALVPGLVGCDDVAILELFPPAGTPEDGGVLPVSAGSPSSEAPPDGGSVVLADQPITGRVNVSQQSRVGHSCPDGGDAVSYSVMGLRREGADLASAPGPGCLEPGDEVILINLQGHPGSSRNVGRHELLRVSAVKGERVEFETPKGGYYGDSETEDDNLGVTRETQRVLLQRVPTYGRLEVPRGAQLTADPWDGTRGGVLVLRVEGEAVIDGRVHLDGGGYHGGQTTIAAQSPGQQGESIEGPGSASFAANLGGGGGGIADQTTSGCQQDGYPGGGGGHSAPGHAAEVRDLCDSIGAGEGGLALGGVGRLQLGSGGGSAGTDNVRTDNPPGGGGGPGGGIVWILAESISGKGSISAEGGAGIGDPPGVECLGGSVTECYDHSGPGGGGAGGSVKLTAPLIDIGTPSAAGGLGGNGNDTVAGNGGDGGSGLVEY